MTTRLFRVEPKDIRIDAEKDAWMRKAIGETLYKTYISERGRLFGDNLTALENYGAGSPDYYTYFVDVPDSVAAKAKRPHHVDNFNEYLLPRVWVKKKKKLVL